MWSEKIHFWMSDMWTEKWEILHEKRTEFFEKWAPASSSVKLPSLFLSNSLKGGNCIKISLPGKLILSKGKEKVFGKSYSLEISENRFSGKTYFYTVHPWKGAVGSCSGPQPPMKWHHSRQWVPTRWEAEATSFLRWVCNAGSVSSVCDKRLMVLEIKSVHFIWTCPLLMYRVDKDCKEPYKKTPWDDQRVLTAASYKPLMQPWQKLFTQPWITWFSIHDSGSGIEGRRLVGSTSLTLILTRLKTL